MATTSFQKRMDILKESGCTLIFTEKEWYEAKKLKYDIKRELCEEMYPRSIWGRLQNIHDNRGHDDLITSIFNALQFLGSLHILSEKNYQHSELQKFLQLRSNEAYYYPKLGVMESLKLGLNKYMLKYNISIKDFSVVFPTELCAILFVGG